MTAQKKRWKTLRRAGPSARRRGCSACGWQQRCAMGLLSKKTLCQIEEKEVYLSAKGREIVRFWQGKQQ